MPRPRILVLTPIAHLTTVVELLEDFADLTYELSGDRSHVSGKIADVDYIFTNPNKNSVLIDRDLLRQALKLRAVCTASTGLTHIDSNALREFGVQLISLRLERELLEKLPSTAELALALTLMGMRNLIPATASVAKGEWDYEQFIGNQIEGKTVGVVGLGRLGRMYARYTTALGARVCFFDPFVGDEGNLVKCSTLEGLLSESDIVSLHAHVNDQSKGMINAASLAHAKSSLTLINTARGELVVEEDVLEFLRKNQGSKYLADVRSNEHDAISNSPLMSSLERQVFLTPHVGGMTVEGQALAFRHAAEMLRNFHNQG